MFYKLSKKETLNKLDTSEKGLDNKEVEKRKKFYGENKLKKAKSISPLKIFIAQFNSFLVYILITAVVLSTFLKEYIDAAVIFFILIVNAIMGFVQEYNAEKSMEALKKLTNLKAKVLRNNKEIEIDSKEIVPGDIIFLEEGSKVPADARIIENIGLQAEEASLTGESTPVNKHDEIINKEVSLSDQKNMVFSSTIITKGKGIAIVTSTGMRTEIGKIAKLIEQSEESLTPLQVKLKNLGELLGIFVIFVCIAVFIAGALKTGEYAKMFIAAIALAVAAIPEGLPAVVTISLSIGVQKMIKNNVLIRKLPSVETLGSTTVICSDKTGTLTKNQMTVTQLYVNHEFVNVSGTGYSFKGGFSKAINKISLLLQTGALCNNAKVNNSKIIGDPTEASLIVSAAKAKLNNLDKKCPKVNEIPFDSNRKLMTTIHKQGNSFVAYSKGAPDKIIEKCNKIIENGKVRKITIKDKNKILKANSDFANKALRVLGFAFKKTKSKNTKETDLIFIGLQAMRDPPRNKVKDDILKCKEAGIRVVMITGDHELTAKAIAKDLGIIGKTIDSKDLKKINLLEEVEHISVYARATPEDKMKITEALKKKGHVVAMTGDGVNDAPALKHADIGIAMGITGTDVAKESSDMILTDDNFSSIVRAIEEGRHIYNNIKKFVMYLMSSNIGEVFTIFTAIIIGMPMPLLAIQILWINLITDGLPALALSLEPTDKNIMKEKPRNKTENIITKNSFLFMLSIGLVMMITTLIVFNQYISINLIYAQTIGFTTLMLLQMYNVINSRSGMSSAFSGMFTNKWLILAIMSSILLQIIVIYTPLSLIFHTTTATSLAEWSFTNPIMNLKDWIIVLIASSSVLIFSEIVKLFKM